MLFNLTHYGEVHRTRLWEVVCRNRAEFDECLRIAVNNQKAPGGKLRRSNPTKSSEKVLVQVAGAVAAPPPPRPRASEYLGEDASQELAGLAL